MGERRKYRLAMLEDNTLREVFHFRVSLLGAISVITLSVMAMIALISLLIVYTPIRNILPGYNESLRQQIIQESARVDSLQTGLAQQRRYLEAVKQLAAGTIDSDTVRSLDSIRIVEREQLLEQRNPATDAFLAQYEQKERDRLAMFPPAGNTGTALCLPVRGAVMQSPKPEQHLYGTVIRTAKNEPVLAVMRGTLIAVERNADNTFTMVLNNGSLTAIYRHVPVALKTQGAVPEAGEVIGRMDEGYDLVIELWDAGTFVNFEERKAF